MTHRSTHIATMEYAFRATLTNIVVANLIYSTMFILIQEPAAYGLFPNFYKNNSWWLGKVSMMQAVPCTVATGALQVFMAINRLSALVNPTKHLQIWNEARVRRGLFSIWLTIAILCIPLIYPIEGSHYEFVSPIKAVGLGFVILGTLPNVVYQTLAMISGALFEITALSIYLFIGCRMKRLKKLPQSAISATVAAVLVSTGAFLLMIVMVPDVLAARIAGKAIWSDEMFYALFKFANAYNNAIAPWVMVIHYSNVRFSFAVKSIFD
ncbi:hypothetical protein PFISCL1PPCAC_5508, partial [Pristionchus fissidentatus]